MPTVALVRLRHAPKEYWFDPDQTGAQEGDHVLVETARGEEMGLCVDGSFEVEEKDIRKPLKPIVRVATEDDLAQAEEMAEKSRGAMSEFRSLVEKSGLDMKPVEVDFLFDGSRATFYFTAEERVDFRGLVRELASEFHVRIDMRQIGVRDEARMLGGLGHCGEELCCRRLGGDFMPVSIRMAKEQDLPLNPAKISGLCGRLMCCLRYEYEAYKDFKGRAPKKNALIETPQGLAKVIEFDTPREKVNVRFEDGSKMMIPVASLDTGDKVPKNGERLRPCHISQEKFDEIIEELHHDEHLAMMGEKLFSDNPDLADQEAKAGAIERNPHRRRRSGSGRGRDRDQGSFRGRRKKGGERGGEHRDQRKRRRSVSATVEGEPHRGHDGQAGAGGSKGAGASDKPKGGNRNRRRRRRHGGSPSAQNGQHQQNGSRNQHNGEGRDKSKPHPGQHSSTVSGDAARHEGGGSGQGSGQNRNKRRRRRRGGGKGGQGGQGSQGKQGAQGGQENRGQHGPSNGEG